MRDYDELVSCLRIEADGLLVDDKPDMLLYDSLRDAADAIEELCKDLERSKEWEKFWENEANEALKKFQIAVADKPKWISVEEPPDNDRNIFICHGSTDFKAPCIGHYDPGMKLFYEDKNWFASPIYDAMFWCEMPKLPLPEPPKEDG